MQPNGTYITGIYGEDVLVYNVLHKCTINSPLPLLRKVLGSDMQHAIERLERTTIRVTSLLL